MRVETERGVYFDGLHGVVKTFILTSRCRVYSFVACVSGADGVHGEGHDDGHGAAAHVGE